MRLFVATTFPPQIIADLNARVTPVRPKLPAASWVRAEAQHLTFAFLGEQDEKLVERISAPLISALSALPSFDATLHDCGFFPNSRHARVGWVGLEPELPFVEIARVVREVVTACGIKLDGGEFKPHLTLMRMRDRWPPASIEAFQRSLREYRSASFRTTAVTLYSSKLNPGGAIHTPLHDFSLQP
jgi:2'-5' RNA ligase